MPTKVNLSPQMAQQVKGYHGMVAEAAQFAINNLIPRLSAIDFIRANMTLHGPYEDDVTVDLSKDGLDEALNLQIGRLKAEGAKAVNKSALLRVGFSLFLKRVGV